MSDRKRIIQVLTWSLESEIQETRSLSNSERHKLFKVTTDLLIIIENSLQDLLTRLLNRLVM